MNNQHESLLPTKGVILPGKNHTIQGLCLTVLSKSQGLSCIVEVTTMIFTGKMVRSELGSLIQNRNKRHFALPMWCDVPAPTHFLVNRNTRVKKMPSFTDTMTTCKHQNPKYYNKIRIKDRQCTQKPTAMKGSKIQHCIDDNTWNDKHLRSQLNNLNIQKLEDRIIYRECPS